MYVPESFYMQLSDVGTSQILLSHASATNSIAAFYCSPRPGFDFTFPGFCLRGHRSGELGPAFNGDTASHLHVRLLRYG